MTFSFYQLTLFNVLALLFWILSGLRLRQPVPWWLEWMVDHHALIKQEARFES